MNKLVPLERRARDCALLLATDHDFTDMAARIDKFQRFIIECMREFAAAPADHTKAAHAPMIKSLEEAEAQMALVSSAAPDTPEVGRYDLNIKICCMVPRANGHWVGSTDYDAIERRLRAVTEERDDIVRAKLKDNGAHITLLELLKQAKIQRDEYHQTAIKLDEENYHLKNVLAQTSDLKDAAERERDALREKVASFERDALRYRWLREAHLDTDRIQMSMVQIYACEVAFEEMDRETDWAMQKDATQWDAAIAAGESDEAKGGGCS